jgi:hypothetical protein
LFHHVVFFILVKIQDKVLKAFLQTSFRNWRWW